MKINKLRTQEEFYIRLISEISNIILDCEINSDDDASNYSELLKAKDFLKQQLLDIQSKLIKEKNVKTE